MDQNKAHRPEADGTLANWFVRHCDNNYAIVTESQCAYYWARKPWHRPHTWADYQAAVRLSERYRRYVHYCTEIAPGWTDVETIYWADNSVTVTQVSADGQRRRSVMKTAPHGDACF